MRSQWFLHVLCMCHVPVWHAGQQCWYEERPSVWIRCLLSSVFAAKDLEKLIKSCGVPKKIQAHHDSWRIPLAVCWSSCSRGLALVCLRHAWAIVGARIERHWCRIDIDGTHVSEVNCGCGKLYPTFQHRIGWSEQLQDTSINFSGEKNHF